MNVRRSFSLAIALSIAAVPAFASAGTTLDEVVAVVNKQVVLASEDDVDSAIAEIEKVNNLTDAELESHLEEAGYTLEEYRVEVARQIMAMRVITIDVTAKNAGADPDVLQQARDRYMNELRSRAYMDIRLGAGR